MLPIGRTVGRWDGTIGAIGRRWRRDTEDHLDRVTVDLDPTNQAADDLPTALPIQLVKPAMNLGGKILYPANHQGQAAFGLGHFDQRLALFLHAREPLLQARDAGLELVMVDHPFGIAVDESANPPTQAVDLAIDSRRLVLVASTMMQLVEAAPEFSGEVLRVLQNSPDLVPDRLLETIATDRVIGARCGAAETMPIGPKAAVVAIIGCLATADAAAGHLAVEGIPTTAADHETLQQPAWPSASLPPVPPILLQLGLLRRVI